MEVTFPKPDQYLTGSARWILVITALSCGLLEIIDSTVVNVSLREMMGSLGATTLEIGWVVTSYAIGNVITIPLSSMLSNIMGRKTYFTLSVVIFTFASLMCGLSANLWTLILWRFIQGLGGGGLLTTSQSIITDAFPPKKLPTATAIFGVGLMIGPAVGPVLGGYITDNWSWHWIFFINVPIGIVAATLSWSFVPDLLNVKPKKIDWPGIIFLITTLCPLQYLLEEGASKYWFESPEITVCFIIATCSLAAFIWRELTFEEPAVNIRLYKNFNLAMGHLMNLILGMALMGMFFIFPLFTQVSLGWTATQQGAFLIPSTIFSAVCMVIVSKVMNIKWMNYNIVAIIGIFLFSAFLIPLSFSSPDSSERNFYGPFFISSLGRAAFMIPVMSMALSGLRGKDLAQATGLSNIMRSLGGAVGIALMGIFINHENAFVRTNMISYVNPYSSSVTERVAAYSQAFLSAGYSPNDATHAAYQILDIALSKQQQMVSYDNAYMYVGVAILVCIPIILLIKKKNNDSGELAEVTAQ
jgi:DHA2 family multidrug resistance protein